MAYKILEICLVTLFISSLYGFPEKQPQKLQENNFSEKSIKQNILHKEKPNCKTRDAVGQSQNFEDKKTNELSKEGILREVRNVKNDDNSEEDGVETIKLIPADIKKSVEHDSIEENGKHWDDDDDVTYSLPTEVKIKYQ